MKQGVTSKPNKEVAIIKPFIAQIRPKYDFLKFWTIYGRIFSELEFHPGLQQVSQMMLKWKYFLPTFKKYDQAAPAQKVLFESLDSDKDGKLNFTEINSGTDIGKEKV